MRSALLVVHILAVVVWVGAGIGATLISPRLVAEGGGVALAWMRVSEKMGSRLYGPASGLTLLSGIGLVLVNDAYGFGSVFVTLGLTAWILVAIGNGAYAGPREKKALGSFVAGDDEEGREILRKVNGFVVVELVLLVVVVIAMVYRW